MKRLAIVRTGPVPIANVSLERVLRQRLDGWQLVTLDVKELVRRSPLRTGRLGLAAGVRYHRDLKAGRWTFRDSMLRTRSSNAVIRELVRRQLRSLDVDAVLQLQSLFDARLAGVPHLVYTDHVHLAGWDSVGKWGQRRAVPRWIVDESELYHQADAVLLRTESMREVLVDRYAVAPDRIAVVGAGPNATVPPKTREDGPPVVLFVGIDWERKGGDLLVEAMRAVRMDHPDARLRVIGDAPSDLPPWVEVIGRVAIDEIGPHLGAASIFCLPTRQESFGVAVIEAMAAGLPCIVSDVGSLPEIVDQGSAGVLVPVDDAAALAIAIRRLLADPERARSIGAAGARRVEDRYSWGRVADAIGVVLNRIVDAEAAPARLPDPLTVGAST